MQNTKLPLNLGQPMTKTKKIEQVDSINSTDAGERVRYSDSELKEFKDLILFYNSAYRDDYAVKPYK